MISMHTPIVFRLAGRYVRRRLLQSLLFVVGVALGVAVMIAIDLASGSASRAFDLSTRSVTGNATHQILGGVNGLPSDVYRRLRTDLGLREVAPLIDDYVLVADQPVRLLGVDAFAEPPFREYLTQVQVSMDEAESPLDTLSAFIAEPGSVLISESLAARFGFAAGDTIPVRAQGERAEMRIVGVIRAGDGASQQALDNLMLADIATAQTLVGAPGLITRVDLIVPVGFNLDRIRDMLPAGASLVTPETQASALRQMTAAFELNLQALSLLGLVVGVFLIYNTVSFSVVQRRPILGIMRALGATRAQIFALILGEAVVLGMIGILIGMGVGVLFGRAAVGLVAQTISDLYFTVNVQGVAVNPAALIKGAAIGLGASLLAAVVPSYDATRTPPAGAMRRSLYEEGVRGLLPWITGGAILLCAIGAVLLTLQSNSIVVSFTALFAIIVGGALLTPAALVVAMRLFTPIGEALFGVVGRMAPRAVSRSLSRTSVAVAALTVAVSVIVGVSVMITSFRGTVADWLDNTLGADIYVSPPQVTATRVSGDLDPALADRLAAVPGVARVVRGRTVTVPAPAYPDLPPVTLAVGSGEVVNGSRRLVWSALPEGANGDYWPSLEAGEVIVSEPFAFRRNITPENRLLTLLTDRGEQTFTIAGVYYDYSSDQGNVLMADSVYRRFYDDQYISQVALFLEPGADAAAVLETIRTEAIAGQDLIAQSNLALRTGVFEVFERTFAITGALRLLAVVVAFIGILSALMALQLEQTRQYGTMRAVGMTPGQLWRYTLIQTGLMGIVAGVLALPIGAALAWVLVYVINVRSFGWSMDLQLNPGEFATALLIAVVAALLAGLYPASRLTTIQPAAALRSE